MLLEPGNALLLCIIHGFLVLVTAPIASESESMDLIFVDLAAVSGQTSIYCVDDRSQHTLISLSTSVFLLITSCICFLCFSSNRLSLDPNARLNGLVTGSKSPGIATRLGWHANAASTPPTLPSFLPCACNMAYLPPQQNPIAPTLFVPGIFRTVLMKPEIIGSATASLCFTNQGPRVAGTMAAFFALSTRPACSWSLSGGSTFWRNEIGRESPS